MQKDVEMQNRCTVFTSGLLCIDLTFRKRMLSHGALSNAVADNIQASSVLCVEVSLLIDESSEVGAF